jgi:hypothetical protein
MEEHKGYCVRVKVCMYEMCANARIHVCMYERLHGSVYVSVNVCRWIHV